MSVLVYFCVPLVVTGQLIVRKEVDSSQSQVYPQYQLYHIGQSQPQNVFLSQVAQEQNEPDTASQNQAPSVGAPPRGGNDPPFSIYNLLRDKNLRNAQSSSSPSLRENREQQNFMSVNDGNLQAIDGPPQNDEPMKQFPHVTLSPPMFLVQDQATGQLFKAQGLQLYQSPVAPQAQLLNVAPSLSPLSGQVHMYNHIILRQPTQAYVDPSAGVVTMYAPPSSTAAPVYRPPSSAQASVYGPPSSDPAPVYGPPSFAPGPVYGPPSSAPAPVYGPPAQILNNAILSSVHGHVVQAVGEPAYSSALPQTLLVKAVPNLVSHAQVLKSPTGLVYQQPLLTAAAPLGISKGQLLSRPVLLNAPSPLYQLPKQLLKTSGQTFQSPVSVPLVYQKAQAPALISQQPVIVKDTAPHTHFKTRVPLAQPLLRTSPVLLTTALKTSSEAVIVPAIEQPLPYVPLISKALPTVSQKSPVYTEKAVLKQALSPTLIKAPLAAHYVESGYQTPSPGTIFSSQKGLINSLIYSNGRKHHGGYSKARGLFKGIANVELVPSLSYGYSYSMYPKSSGPYGPPRHGHRHHHHK